MDSKVSDCVHYSKFGISWVLRATAVLIISVASMLKCASFLKFLSLEEFLFLS